MKTPSINLAASCLCGAVRLDVRGQVLSMFQCACHACQRASGAGHASIVMLNAADVTMAGAVKSFSRPADSGAILTTQFCPICANRLTASSSRAAHLALLPLGIFAGNTDWFKPSQLIFARSLAPWDLIDPALPRYQTYRENEAPS